MTDPTELRTLLGWADWPQADVFVAHLLGSPAARECAHRLFHELTHHAANHPGAPFIGDGLARLPSRVRGPMLAWLYCVLANDELPTEDRVAQARDGLLTAVLVARIYETGTVPWR